MCRTRDPTPRWHRFDWWRALLFFARNLFETEGNQFVLLNRVHHFHQSDELNHVLKQNHVLYCNWTILHAFSTSRNRLAFRLFRKSLSDSDLIFFRKNPLKHLQHLFCLGQRKSQNESRIHFRIHQQQQQVCVCVCMAYLRAVEMFHFFLSAFSFSLLFSVALSSRFTILVALFTQIWLTKTQLLGLR